MGFKRVLTHNAVDIQGGARNIVDAFVHPDSLSWKDKEQVRRMGFNRQGKPVELQELVELEEKALEAALEDENTDDKMSALFTNARVVKYDPDDLE